MSQHPSMASRAWYLAFPGRYSAREKGVNIDTSARPALTRKAAHSNAFLLIITILALCLVAPKWILPSSPSCAHAKHPSIQYEGEKISWKPCGDVSGKPVECSNITVPMDQFDEENSGVKTFLIPLIRLRGKENAQNLLLNPGGPGGSGIEFIFRRGKQLSDIVGDGFHLLSFDPRGVNSSLPMASCYPNRRDVPTLAEVRSYEFVHDSPEAYGWTHNFVKACADTMDVHGAYINTPQTAADMNSILDAVGQDDMAYWGFSYGTILGQTYASLFPERSKRVIIDGVANNFNWYGNKLDAEEFTNSEDVLEGFFDECIKAGKNCSLSSLADSPKELHKLVFDFAEGLKDQPISVYVNSTMYGLFDYPTLVYSAIFPRLYAPAKWYGLAENLAKLLKGNATDAWIEYRGDPWGLSDESNNFVTKNDALSGPEYWTQSRHALLDKIIATYNGSLFGPSEIIDAYVEQQWKIPRTHNFTQEEGVKTAHPLLILSTTYDPICPLVSAKAANRAFVDSKIVEVEGYGHCSVAVTSTCLAKRVREFLYQGKLPESHVKCEVDGPYFIKPEEDGKVVAQKAFEDPEDERIHLAQLELARDWEWRPRRFGI